MGRRRRTRTVLAAFTVTLAAAVAAACAPAHADNEIIMWSALTSSIDWEGQQRIAAAFEEQNPGVSVRLIRKPARFTSDSTNLITAVRSGDPPDIILLDRFTVSQNAALGLLTNLNDYVEQEGGQDFLGNYLDYTIAEGSYEGGVYALPVDADARGLYYNKELFREAGVDMDFLDPANGPPTIAEVMTAAEQLTKTDDRGNYTQLGFIPWSGQAFHATWGLSRGAEFFDNETCEVTPQEPAFLETFRFFAKWSERLNRDRVSAFEATYQPPEAPPTQTMFFTNRLAMAIDGNWYLSNIREYAPDLDYGITYLPVAEEGGDPFTWSGGFAMVMPKGAKNADLAWDFMTFMSGPDGQRIWIDQTNKIPVWAPLLDDDTVVEQQGVFAEMAHHSTIRPPLPVGGQISDAMGTAQEAVLLGEQTPEEAMQAVYDRVQPQMDRFCPFTLEYQN